jgi:biotin carboxyl carrier protein
VKNAFVTTIGERTFTVEPADDQTATINGTSHLYNFSQIKDDRYSLILDGRCFEVTASISRNGVGSASREILVSVNGNSRVVQVDDEQTYRLKSLFSRAALKSRDQTMKAPMPGLISRLEVVAGDEVVPGKRLLVLEAMKMENEIKSTVKGKVSKVFVVKGKVVEKGEELISISTE